MGNTNFWYISLAKPCRGLRIATNLVSTNIAPAWLDRSNVADSSELEDELVAVLACVPCGLGV